VEIKPASLLILPLGKALKRMLLFLSGSTGSNRWHLQVTSLPPGRGTLTIHEYMSKYQVVNQKRSLCCYLAEVLWQINNNETKIKNWKEN